MRRYTPGNCLNCEAATPNPKALYCGERCRQIAELVRYTRRKFAEGTYKRPDIAEAIAIRRSQLATGFYDKRARKVTSEIRQELLARSNGRCEKCGCDFAPEGDARFTVQHTDADDGMVLEAWCYRCNMNHAQSVIIGGPINDDLEFFMWFNFRVRALQPALLCDDADNWPAIYRQLQAQQRHSGKSRSRPDDNDTPVINPENPRIMARERVEALIRARPDWPEARRQRKRKQKWHRAPQRRI
ncbi:MAG: hypothetical protein ACREFK_16040 [Stellaceae bacterium]